MLPLMMKLKIPREGKKPFNIYLPVFVAWILVFAVFLLCLPFILIAGIFTWHLGYGKIALAAFPMVFHLLWHMRGLKIDVEGKNETVYMSFF